MTTLVGICSENETEVVLASDRQVSHNDDSGNFQSKGPAKKLYVENRRDLAFGIAGVYDRATVELIKAVVDGSIDLRKRIDEGKFPELLEINLERYGGKLPDLNLKESTGLFVSTRYEKKPQLFTCWPLGKIEGRQWTCIGSGSKYVEAYFQAEEIVRSARPSATIFKKGKISHKVARELAYRAVRYAAKDDPYSSGLDLVVVGADGIIEFGDRISAIEESAQDEILKMIRG